MKKTRRGFSVFTSLLLLTFAYSCSGPKQVFYFQQGPATPKVAQQQAQSEPVYTASNAIILADLPVKSLATANENTATTTTTKKELRKLLKQTIKDLRDSTKSRSKEKRIGVKANKYKLSQIESEARELKNSVRVQNDDKKVVVDVKKPSTTFSQTELILLGVAALLILVILLSLPVIGTILGVVLGLAVIAAALGILLGIIEINV